MDLPLTPGLHVQTQIDKNAVLHMVHKFHNLGGDWDPGWGGRSNIIYPLLQNNDSLSPAILAHLVR